MVRQYFTTSKLVSALTFRSGVTGRRDERSSRSHETRPTAIVDLRASSFGMFGAKLPAVPGVVHFGVSPERWMHRPF